MKKVFLFDLGDTLIQYYTRSEFPDILKRSMNEVRDYLRSEGLLSVSDESIRAGTEAENYESENFAVRPLEERLTRIFQFDAPSDEVLMTACRHFMKPIFAVAKCYDDVVPVLQELGAMGAKRVIVSNTPWGCPAELWRDEISRFGIDRHTDAAFFCRDAGWRKPARQIFDYILEKLGASPQDCVFVGDNPRWDIEGPESVGIEAILIDRRGAMHDTGREIIKSLYELITKEQ